MSDLPDLPFEKTIEKRTEHIGRYRIVSEIGRGAMGIVYLGEDEGLGRKVAIKTILASIDAVEQAGYLARFRQEAKVLGGLNHPAIRQLVTIREQQLFGKCHAIDPDQAVIQRHVLAGYWRSNTKVRVA